MNVHTHTHCLHKMPRGLFLTRIQGYGLHELVIGGGEPKICYIYYMLYFQSISCFERYSADEIRMNIDICVFTLQLTIGDERITKIFSLQPVSYKRQKM